MIEFSEVWRSNFGLFMRCLVVRVVVLHEYGSQWLVETLGT